MQKLIDYTQKYTPIFHEMTLTDDEWEMLEPFFPPLEYKGRGRRPLPTRKVFQAFLYLLVCPVPTRHMKRFLGVCDETISTRVDGWIRGAVFHEIWGIALGHYEDFIGLDLSRFLVDGCLTKTPNGGQQTGESPVDRGKSGTKRSLGTDAKGVPLAIIQAPANTHDTRLLEDTVGSIKDSLTSVDITPEIPLVLHLDLGYRGPIAAAAAQDQACEIILPTINTRKREARKRAPVECCHKKFNCFRGLLFRQFRSHDRQAALLMMAAAIIIWRACSRRLARRPWMN